MAKNTSRISIQREQHILMALFALPLLFLSVLAYPRVYAGPDNDLTDVLIGFNGEPDESVVMAQSGGGGGVIVKYNFHPFLEVLAARIPQKAIVELSKNPNISYIEPDAEVHTMGHASAIPEYINSVGVDHIEADKVHAKHNKGYAIKICILDTGTDYNHPDLALRYRGGKDFVNKDNDPMDDNGHGTHVAGTAAAILNDAGVVGVAPKAYLFVGKVLNRSGSGSYSNVIAGINWCLNNNVKIISMSFGGTSGSAALRDAVNTAYGKGKLLVAAAGNSGNCLGNGESIEFPAKYASVIAVTNTDSSDIRACTSSTGDSAELSAPGIRILSTRLGGGYGEMSGTSMSTPHVSGSAALVWRSDETAWSASGYTNGDTVWTNIEVRTVLDNSAQDLGALGRDSLYGYGLVRPDIAIK